MWALPGAVMEAVFLNEVKLFGQRTSQITLATGRWAEIKLPHQPDTSKPSCEDGL